MEVEIFKAVEEGNLNGLTSMLQSNDVSANICDENGMSALMQAAYKGKLEICQFLVKSGADVNMRCDGNGYTPLMMAALSGSVDIVTLLLDHGADCDKQNSIGKTAGNLAAFVGQHECSVAIRNYLSKSKLIPYTKSHGGSERRLPSSVVSNLQKLVTSCNPHPVSILLTLKDCPELCDAAVLKQVENVLVDLCSKCVRTTQDYDEILALKLHYYSTIMKLAADFLSKNDATKLDKLVKKLLHTDGNGFPVAIETSIRTSMRSFPYTELPAFQEFIMVVAKTKIGSEPTAITCLINLLHGLRAGSARENVCVCCGHNRSPLRCSSCKKVHYCTQRCQKLHWSVHKGFCRTS